MGVILICVCVCVGGGQLAEAHFRLNWTNEEADQVLSRGMMTVQSSSPSLARPVHLLVHGCTLSRNVAGMTRRRSTRWGGGRLVFRTSDPGTPHYCRTPCYPHPAPGEDDLGVAMVIVRCIGMDRCWRQKEWKWCWEIKGIVYRNSLVRAE